MHGGAVGGVQAKANNVLRCWTGSSPAHAKADQYLRLRRKANLSQRVPSGFGWRHAFRCQLFPHDLA
jgi:hypothetical protein